MIVPIEYLQLRDALRDHPDYAHIPNDDKQSCAMFVHMMKDIDEGRPVGESSLAKMFELAFSEAHRFQKKGRLAGIKLPEAPAAPEKPGPKVNNKQAALAAAPAVTAALGDAPAPVVNTTTKANDPTPETPDATPEPTTTAANDAVQVQETPAVPEPARPSDVPPQNPAALAIRHDVLVCEAEVVDDDPASEISRLHGEIEGSLRVSVDHAIRIGELLVEQKESLGHGEFLPWVAGHLPFSERTARNYMSLFKRRAELESANVADLTTAYRLTAPRKAKPKSTGKAKPSDANGTRETTQAQDDPKAQTDAADTSEHGQHQAQQDEQPGAGASTASSSTASEERPTAGQADEQPDAATSSGRAENDKTSSTAATETTGQDQQAEQAKAKPTATETATTEAKPPAHKLTIKQLVNMTVNIAAQKPALAQDIIYRTAEAAGIEVVIVDAVTRDAVKELARLLGNKLDDLAANDYEDASDLLTGFVENLWEGVNAHQPDDEEGDPVDDDGCEEITDDE